MSSPSSGHTNSSLSNLLEFFGAGRGTAPFDPEAAPRSPEETQRSRLIPLAVLGEPPKSAYEKHQASLCRKKLHNETVSAGLIAGTTYCFGYRVLLRRKPINLNSLAIAATLFWFTKMGYKQMSANSCAHERMMDTDPRATTAAFLRSAYKEHLLAKRLVLEVGAKPAPLGKLNVTDMHALAFVKTFESKHGKIPRLSEVEWPTPTKWQQKLHEKWLREQGALAPEYEQELDRLGYPRTPEEGSEASKREKDREADEEAWWQDFKPREGAEKPSWMVDRPWHALLRI